MELKNYENIYENIFNILIYENSYSYEIWSAVSYPTLESMFWHNKVNVVIIL